MEKYLIKGEDMIKKIITTLQISAVFIGTIVGAGLASGQEIKQFFSTYGYKSFIGICICCMLYIFTYYIIVNLSQKYNLKSYNDLIMLISPGLLGKATHIFTTLFLLSSASIILAGSGALIHQYFNVSKWVGLIIMAFLAVIFLLRDTKGLIEVNSIIVPSLFLVIITVFILYLFFYDNMSISYIKSIKPFKSPWLLSCLLYGSFNILSSSGVMVPLSREINNFKITYTGIVIGALGLTILSLIINLLLILNIPYIFNYEIPLLYVSNRFGGAIQVALLAIIWLEMFSTEVSDVFSVSKNLEQKFKIPYKNGCFIILTLAISISQIGFVKLITFLYPAFGVVGIIFIVQCFIFYFKNKRMF